ncbi:unnamed protein product, partial [marine sediment metagenome]
MPDDIFRPTADDVWRDTVDDEWIVFNEKFESIGYDEYWSEGETVEAGCVLDEDYTTSSVTGVPEWWGSKCLRVVTGGNNASVKHIFNADFDKAYFRAEIIIEDVSSFTTNDYGDILRLDNVAGSPILHIHVRYNNGSGKVDLEADTYEDDVKNTITLVSDVSLDHPYRIELKWDQDSNEYELRLDDVNVRDQTDNALTSARMFGGIRLGSVDQSQGYEFFVDNVKVETQEFPGAEASSSSSESSSSSSSSSSSESSSSSSSESSSSSSSESSSSSSESSSSSSS